MNEEGEFLPAREVGKIVIEGPNVIPEYWRKPEATAESRRGEWFRSGYFGYLDADGFLYVSARAKDMIISGGENIYPAAIEQMLMEIADLDWPKLPYWPVGEPIGMMRPATPFSLK
ncbi:AMP-binding protein [Gulosibacter macacae]|nr:AMP-binding protein [Gulosibacter macacae]